MIIHFKKHTVRVGGVGGRSWLSEALIQRHEMQGMSCPMHRSVPATQ